jgi:ubiquinone/menaquinone biosynthesis C-methylase UbiE
MTTNSPYIEETAFGNWFLRTKTWKFSVVRSALDDLSRMLPADMGRYPKVIDIGCGFGHSFAELSRRFAPDLIVGMDADPDMQAHARAAAEACATQVRLHRANAAHIDLPSDEFDLVLCHQTYHHIVEQEAAMAEFFRILKPGGFLLFAESTRRFIHSLPIKLLFRHPMDVQRTAEEYLAMIRAAGFELSPERVSMPYLWWSRPDLGLLELLGLPVARQREETLVNAVARKPLL